jgi:hypothetical protein
MRRDFGGQLARCEAHVGPEVLQDISELAAVKFGIRRHRVMSEAMSALPCRLSRSTQHRR